MTKISYNIINPTYCNGELARLPIYSLRGKVGQNNSHTLTYMEMREVYQKDLGQIMGLDKIVLGDEKDGNNVLAIWP